MKALMPVTSGLPKKVLIVGAVVFGREARRESQLAGRLALKTGLSSRMRYASRAQAR